MEVGWFFFALGGPVLWAIGNFLDKFLVERLRTTTRPVGILILYSSLFSLVVIPLLYIVNKGDILSVPPENIPILIFAGIIETVAIGLYLQTLAREETSTVIPLFQTIPIFGFIAGFFLLGETLTTTQILAVLVVICGSMVLTLEFSEEKQMRLKTSTLYLALASSAAFALFDAFFKYGAENGSFFAAVFWQHIGIVLVGILIFVSQPRYRRVLVASLRTSDSLILGLNILNELLYVAGVVLLTFALLLAPIALVATVSVYQPVFVFLIGILLATFFPNLIQETLSLKHLLQKGAAIGIILIGSVFLIM